MNKRKQLKNRKLFTTTIKNLKMILPCYDKKLHYQVIINYLKVYNLFQNNDTIKGKILFELGRL